MKKSINGEIMSWTNDLFDYFDKVDPGFRGRVKGISDAEIQKLEHAMGSPVPQVHQDYLRVMGRNDGGLFEASRARTDVEAVLELIEVAKEENPTVDFRTFKPIAVGDVFEGWALSQEEDVWPVVFIEHNLPGKYVAQGFPHLAFSAAFGRRMKTANHRVRFIVRNSQIKLPDLGKQAVELGFLPEWFCDHLSYFAVRAEVLLQIHSRIGLGFDGSVAGADFEVVRQLARQLAESLNGKLTYEK